MTVSLKSVIGLFCVTLLVLSGTGTGEGYEGGSGTEVDPTVSCVKVEAGLSLVQGPPKEVQGSMELDCTISHIKKDWTWSIELELTDTLGTK